MDPFSLSASVIAVLQISGTVISTLYDYRAGIVSASKDAARLISELNSLRSVLESLLSTLDAEASSPPACDKSSTISSPRLATISKLAQPDGELQRCQSELEKLAKKLELNDDSKLGKMKHALMWPLRKEQVDAALESLQRAKSTMSLALITDQVALAMEVQKGVTNLAELFATSSLDQRKMNIRAWLAAPNPFTNHSIAQRRRQALTGVWFLKGKQYHEWMTAPGAFLWLYGIPGCGKSVLCSSIIENISSRCISQPSIALSFYYFDFNDLGKRDVRSMAQALVAQLVAQCPNGSASLAVIYSDIEGGVQQPDLEYLIQILRLMVQSFQQTYIVIDALDECSECEELMGFVEKLYSWNISQLRIITTSRQLSEIEETVGQFATEKLCLQDSKISTDILMLIRHRLDTDRKFQKWPVDVRNEIQSTLIQGAHGMFRWVYCQLEMLRNCVTLHALRKALISLPKTLDDTYERILANIDESYTEDVQKILQYLAFCQWAPTLTEMVEVLAIDWDREDPQFDVQNRIPDPKDILTMCSSLVTTSEGHVQYIGESDISAVVTLRLAHFSVKEYIISSRIITSTASSYAVSSISANLFITRTYLMYLLQPEFSSGHLGWQSTLIRFKNYPLANTSSQLWTTQIRLIGDDGNKIDPVTKDLILKFFNTRHLPNGGSYSSWVGSLIPDSPLRTIQNTHPLYYCASYGLTTLVRLLLKITPKSDIDKRGGRALSSPLHVAVYRCKIDCVRLLLESGADPNGRNSRQENCLYWARGKMREDIYKLLIKYGAVEMKHTFVATRDIATAVMVEEVKAESVQRGEVQSLEEEKKAKFLSSEFQRLRGWVKVLTGPNVDQESVHGITGFGYGDLEATEMGLGDRTEIFSIAPQKEEMKVQNVKLDTIAGDFGSGSGWKRRERIVRSQEPGNDS